MNKLSDNDMLGINRKDDEILKLVAKIEGYEKLYQISIIILEKDFELARDVNLIKDTISKLIKNESVEII